MAPGAKLRYRGLKRHLAAHCVRYMTGAAVLLYLRLYIRQIGGMGDGKEKQCPDNRSQKRFHNQIILHSEALYAYVIISAMRIAVAIYIVLFLATASYAQEEALNSLKADLLSFFKPLKGSVTAMILSSDGSMAISDLGASSGIRKGMRFVVKRAGSVFHHPVTGEPLGKIETPVGRAEVVDAANEGAVLRVISGEAKMGDILRVSSARVPVLFSESAGVDWFLADEYSRRLKETDRFDLIDTPPVLNDAEVIERAKTEGAEVAVILYTEDSTLRQRLLWADDAREFYAGSVKVDEGFIKRLRLGEELFFPKGDTVK